MEFHQICMEILGNHSKSNNLAKQKEFLVFEDGPSQDIELQWVSYKDAADQCSLSIIFLNPNFGILR